MMKTLLYITILTLGIVGSLHAQTPLETARQAAVFCQFSHPSPDSGVNSGIKQYDETRRRVSTDLRSVRLTSAQLKPIGYQRASGLLTFNAFDTITATEGVTFAVTQPELLAFDVAEHEALKLLERYELGTARIELRFVPASFSNYDQPLCKKETNKVEIEIRLVEVRMVDELGRTLAKTETPLGEKLGLQKRNVNNAFMANTIPVVKVASLVGYTADRQKSPLTKEERNTIERSLNPQLMGCYTRALANNARFQGAIVVRVSEGTATTLIDSLSHKRTENCLHTALEAAAARTLPRRLTASKWSLLFKLQASSRL